MAAITAKMLAKTGHEVAVYDNLSRGHRDLVNGEASSRAISAIRNCCAAMRWFKPDAVIHFAAFAYVGESVTNPHMYYDNNVGGTLSILKR